MQQERLKTPGRTCQSPLPSARMIVPLNDAQTDDWLSAVEVGRRRACGSWPPVVLFPRSGGAWGWTLLLVLWLCCVLPATAVMPTRLWVADLRGIAGQPELETWLGSLQGVVNRQDSEIGVFLIRNESDAAYAEMLSRSYGVPRETLTPRALLARAGARWPLQQIRYDAAQPWTRNVALTLAACAPEATIVAPEDLGLPTKEDLTGRWADRRAAYGWLTRTYGAQVGRAYYVLAPESGHTLSDFIVARKALAVDYAPTDVAEAKLLGAIDAGYPAGAVLVGSADARAGDAADEALVRLVSGNGRVVAPARYAANLSCLMRFPLTRPAVQQLAEVPSQGRVVTLIYGSSGSLDDAMYALRALVADPAMAELPVGVEVPMALQTFAPAVYQALLARQRQCAFELIAAPQGPGVTRVAAQPDLAGYVARWAREALALGLGIVALRDAGTAQGYQDLVGLLANYGLRGTVDAPDPSHVEGVTFGFTAAVATARVGSVDELRATLKAHEKTPFLTLYLDPQGLPPATVRGLLPELRGKLAVMTPTQASRTREEFAPLLAYLQAKASKSASRGKPQLQATTPSLSVAAPQTGEALTVSTMISGGASVASARIIYTTPDGRVGGADLRPGTGGAWSAALPPVLDPGTLTLRARVVDASGFGETLTAPLRVTVRGSDADADGVDDVREAYQGSDPQLADTDADGLPDARDAWPARADRDTVRYGQLIQPPNDAAYVCAAGTSTADADGRALPAGSQVTYRLPAADLPMTPCALRVVTRGAGTATVNGGAPVMLESFGDMAVTTDLPVTPDGAALTVTLTAGPDPLHLDRLAVISNPDGPYLLTATLDPAVPPAGMPIGVRALVYDPDGVRSVRLRYGPTPAETATLDLHPDADGRFSGELPSRANGLMVYAVEATDAAGHTAQGCWQMTPVGQTRGHNVALLGGRDLQGDWLPGNGPFTRELARGTADDHHLFLARPGAYSLWVHAAPRSRGVRVTVQQRGAFTREVTTLLDNTARAGTPDGWVKLGAFSVNESMRLHIDVTPVGADGYCAYGALVLTQDARLAPPVSYARLDWTNSLLLGGLDEGQTITGKVELTVAATGNLDAVDVTVEPRGNTRSIALTPLRGVYTLDARQLPPGEYLLRVTGLRLTYEEGKRRKDALLEVTRRFMVGEQ